MDDLDKMDPAIVGQPDSPVLLFVCMTVLAFWLIVYFFDHPRVTVPTHPTPKADCTTPAR